MKVTCEVLIVVGARPQFVKVAPLIRAFRNDQIAFSLVDTGQHYDEDLRATLFDELELPVPDYCLNVGSGSHGYQTAHSLLGIERAIEETKPHVVMILGDTNATLAGALAAAKAGTALAHVEAGLRSYDRSMPEEVNRVLVDHVSSLLFCPGAAAAENLRIEGIAAGIHLVGDVMVDSLQWALTKSVKGLQLPESDYAVATLHRPATVDHETKLKEALACLAAADLPVLFPVHPRTRLRLDSIPLPGNVTLTKPLSFVQMVQTMARSSLVITDSGGMQKEAYLLRKRVLTLRDTTEWVETLEGSWNQLTGTDVGRFRLALQRPPDGSWKPLYGDGDASRRISAVLREVVGR